MTEERVTKNERSSASREEGSAHIKRGHFVKIVKINTGMLDTM